MPAEMTVVPQTASWARRALALVVDWFACIAVVILVAGWHTYTRPGGPAQFYVLALFVFETALFTATAGGSLGKLVTRLRTVRADGVNGPLDPLRSLARSILVALVIPPLIFRPDGRGLHDLAAGTSTVTLDTFRAIQPR